MQERSHIIAIPALSPRFGQLKIDPQSAFAKGSANPQHAAEDAAEPFIGALRLLDMMEVDILVKPSENPVGDSFVLTHQNKPVRLTPLYYVFSRSNQCSASQCR